MHPKTNIHKVLTRVSVVVGLTGQFGSSAKAVLLEKLEGAQCIEPVKSRVPTYDFYTKKLEDFLVI